MKNTDFKLLVVALIILSMTSISCTSDDDSNEEQSEQQIISQIENNLINGSWRITEFIDSGEDETNHFVGYNFIFGANGVVTAGNSSSSYEGSWSITGNDNSDDDDDDDTNDLDFNINFNLSNDFEELNEDWDIITHSSNKIELIDISGGNGETDYLTFEKN